MKLFVLCLGFCLLTGQSWAAPLTHPVHLKWKGEIFGVKATLDDRISLSRWQEDLVAPSIPFAVHEVVDGDRNEVQDSNGLVRKGTGTTHARDITNFLFWNGSWSNELKDMKELAKDAKGRRRLEWRPKGGALAQITLDQDNLPAEVSVDHGGGEMMRTELSQWKEFDGNKFPTHQVIHDPGIVELETWDLEDVKSFNDKPFPPFKETVDWHFPEKTESVTLPLTLYGERYVMLPVTVGGVHTLFILDTGASVTILNLSLAKKLGLHVAAKLTQPVGVLKDFYYIRSPVIDVGGATVDSQTVIAIDMDSGEFGSKMPGLGGIIGYDFLSRFVVTLDYPQSRLTLAPVPSFKPKADDSSIPVEIDDGALIVPVKVHGTDAKFILDTGNGGTPVVQHVPGQKSWVTAAEKRFYDANGTRFGSGVAGRWYGYVPLEVGPYKSPREPVAIVDEGKAAGGSLSMAGNLGSTFLKNFRVSIDMKTPRLWFAQTIPFRDRKGIATYGVSFSGDEKDSQKYIVKSMDAGGPGAKAKLKIGDRVLSINGMEMAKAMPNLYHLFAEPAVGEKIHLIVQRQGKSVPVTVTAELVP